MVASASNTLLATYTQSNTLTFLRMVDEEAIAFGREVEWDVLVCLLRRRTAVCEIPMLSAVVPPSDTIKEQTHLGSRSIPSVRF
jgi:hypothetical protein